jgi:hypothetical protein
VTEEQCLNEIFIDEHFGPPEKKGEEEKKKYADVFCVNVLVFTIAA